MLLPRPKLVALVTVLSATCLLAGVRLSPADIATVRCVIQPDAKSASISVTNPLTSEASCRATCAFETATYDDKPRITCTGPVAAGKEIELCVMHAKTSPLVKFLEGSADCRKL
ncbi:hypothetical protein [Afipia sp. 1NLS2]|uniref:hypothetical protein n=1 Tax=Afipia sp. 1NLS2 TaxID=666684 RepID=UPI0001D9EBC0|nr:hypothetical protein [Afipia sp. 1NLS2]EFI51848.1 hypothetical protein AfiDRAFT_2134 [Afipia sp. 1NLS2]